MKYQQRLYYHIRRLLIKHDDTDDALQNTFIKVWESLSNFRMESEIYTWMYRIATNEALNILRNNKRRHAKQINDDASAEMAPGHYDLGPDGDAIQQRLHKAVISLPQKQQLVFNMKYYDDMKYDDMSKILGTSVGALKASYHLAVKKIEKSVLED